MNETLHMHVVDKTLGIMTSRDANYG